MAWLNYAKCRDKVDTWVILMVELVQSLRECQWICNQFRDWIVKFVVEEFEDSWYSLKTNYITYTREEYGPVLDCRVLAIADLLADTFSHGLIPIEEMGSALLLLAKKCSRYEHVHVMHILLYRGQIRYSQEPLPRALLNKCRRALQEDLPEPEYFFLDSMEYSRLTLEVVEEIDYLLHYTDCDNSKAVIEGLN
ncbi:hypothetical protein AX16_007411 [Volvariella volvacea WC 439]|nr:hypothetical protein AX16_007411 [Volvariella volvacea WC 439]